MTTRAVLFDFGGTLYDYSTLLPGDAESLLQLCQWAGVTADAAAIRRAQRESMRRVFHTYLPQRYYLHRDLFRDAIVGTLEALGVTPAPEHLARYREMQWRMHARDFRLRDGVVETLRALRERGLHVGMVSNIDDDQLEHLIEVAGLRAHFDSLLSSESVNSCKPDPAIFSEALQRAGCNASEALFVGDTLAQDIAGAQRMGMRTALIWHRADKEPAFDDVRPEFVIREIPQLLAVIEEIGG